MKTSPKRILAAACVVGLLLAGSRFTVNKRVLKFDPRDVAGYISSLYHSSGPEAAEIRARIENSGADLDRELKAAASEGIPLKPADLTQPIPAGKNAGPLYTRLERLRFRPGRTTLLINYPLENRWTYSPADLARARREFDENKPIVSLIMQASDRPQCDFLRDWKLGDNVPTPEHAAMRSAVRLVHSKSYLLAKDGRFADAVAMMARGFKIAEHAGSDPLLLGWLVEAALDEMTLSGVEDLLQMASRDADTCKRVAAAITANRPRYNMRKSFGGEIVIARVFADRLRALSPTDFTIGYFGDSEDEWLELKKPPPATWTSEERRFMARSLDASEAGYLSLMRQLCQAAALPLLERRRKLEEIAGGLQRLPRSPLQILERFCGPPLHEDFGYRELLRNAQAAVDAAAANLLAYRAVHGSFPEDADRAIMGGQVDPFTNEALKYRREPKGFVVYSLGPTLKFDGGKPGMIRSHKEAYFRFPASPRTKFEPIVPSSQPVGGMMGGGLMTAPIQKPSH